MTKPTIGQPQWGQTLNDHLDTLSAVNPTLASIVYNSSGDLVGYVESGQSISLSYDGEGRISTITTGTTTRTVSYDAAGNVTGVA